MKLIIAALALVLGISAAATSHAFTPVVPKYGSIALNTKNGAFGYSYRYGSPYKARRVAYRFCRKFSGYRPGCRSLTVFRNQCGALVRNKFRGNYGWGVARTRYQALRNAYYFCNKYGGGCQVKVVFCSR